MEDRSLAQQTGHILETLKSDVKTTIDQKAGRTTVILTVIALLVIFWLIFAVACKTEGESFKIIPEQFMSGIHKIVPKKTTTD